MPQVNFSQQSILTNNRRRINTGIQFLIAAVFTIACTVLFGWLYDITILKKVSPDFISMSPNTAICFILLSISIFANLNDRNSILLRFLRYLPYIAILMSAIAILNITFGFKFNLVLIIARWISGDSLKDFQRMAEITALNFIFLAICILYANKSKDKANPLLMAFILFPLVTSLVVISGYIYDVQSLYSFGIVYSVSLNAAISFILMSVSLIMLYKDNFILRIFLSDSPGLVLLRRLIPAVIILPGLINLLTMVGVHNGIYSQHFGDALEMSANLIVLASIMFWSANQFYKSDIAIKHAEESIILSEKKYKTLFESIPIPVYIANKETLKILSVNESAVNTYGYSRDEWSSLFITDIRPEAERQRFLDEVRKDYSYNRGEWIHQKKDGTLIDVEITRYEIIYENQDAYVVLINDITEQKKTNALILKLSRAVEQSFASALIADLEGNIEYVNPQFEQITGYSGEEVIGKKPSILKSGKTKPEVYAELWNALTSGKEWNGELLNKKKNGDLYWENVSISPIKDETGKIMNFLAIFEDITQRKLNDERLSQSLKDKNLMLQEIHHRVMNNLQIISSLLKLQSAYIKVPAVITYFVSCQNRIKSMALIHEQLFNTQKLTEIDFNDYLSQLSRDLNATYNTNRKDIKIEVSADNICLNIETAIPCGLLVNELVSNSLKHAFHGRKRGKIKIEVKKNDNGQHQLSVRDNGTGFHNRLDIKNPQTLGAELIASLAEQLQGKPEMKFENGAEFRIIFNELEYMKRV